MDHKLWSWISYGETYSEYGATVKISGQRDFRYLKTFKSFNLFKADLTDQVNKRDKFKKIDRITPLLPIQDSYTLEYYRHNG